ncbi:hypothetical protein PtA15_5A895 [Puccinia triticina]|nr:uncharacterized protein PtA15_5A895 [Puccinia triticina]WAQ85320.1 hypothetical protein PtA15_5A895 [Puccinia triticina]
MDAIEDCATRAVGAIGRQLGHLIGLINPAAPRRYPFLSRPLSHQPIINLATKATPLIKLTQLFFKKLSKHGIMNCRTLPSFTPMNSYQLERLCQSAENVSPCLEELLISLGELDTTLEDRRLDTLLPIITKSAEDTASTLSASLLSVVLYLIPLIDSLPEQNYYQSWFATWNTQINIAVRNVVQVARDLRDLQYDSEDDSD